MSVFTPQHEQSGAGCLASASYWCSALLGKKKEKKRKNALQVCPQGTTMQRDAMIPKVAVSELSLCARNSITVFIMLGLIIGLKSLFKGKT